MVLRKRSVVLMMPALFAGILMVPACSSPLQPAEVVSKQDQAIERKVDSILSIMTLEEKIGQMTQVRHFELTDNEEVARKFIGSVIQTDGPTPGSDAASWQTRFRELQEQALSTRLGIPLLIGADAVHGQNTFEGATIFPHNIGLGATRNADLVEKVAAVTALELQATGLNWTFSPCVAVPFDERWGRVYEAFSESPELTAELGAASVRGYQGNLQDPTSVLATAKHFIGDGATEKGREGGSTVVSPQELNDLLLPPYRRAVEQGAGAVMVSFNSLNGTTMHVHRELITDTLKHGMGFDGIVLTDWKGYSRFGGNEVINAGVDMVMAVDGDLDVFQEGLRKGVETGEVPMARVDDAVRRILRQKYRLGLFEHPYPDTSLTGRIGAPSHRNLARQAVRESMVLLKNDGAPLPIPGSAEKIVVVGEHAGNAGLQSGGWTIAWQGVSRDYRGATTILQGIEKEAPGKVIYDERATGNHTDADVVIIVVGETPYAEFMGDIGGEESDYQLTLSREHQRYVEAYAGKGPAVVVVLISGRPLVTTGQIALSDAFVAAWLPGSEGDGIAEVLFGRFGFSGKLPHSWPASTGDYTGTYGPNFWDGTSEPLFEYGYGLEY